MTHRLGQRSLLSTSYFLEFFRPLSAIGSRTVLNHGVVTDTELGEATENVGLGDGGHDGTVGYRRSLVLVGSRLWLA